MLKLCYNSARANVASDLDELRRLRLYILGQKRQPKRIAVYLTLLFRHPIPDDVRLLAGKKGISITATYEPDMLRLGHFFVDRVEWSAPLSRTAIFQSFLFYIIGVGEKAPAVQLERLKQTLAALYPDSGPLTASGGKVRVKASLPAHKAFDTHIEANLPFYSREHPEIFGQ